MLVHVQMARSQREYASAIVEAPSVEIAEAYVAQLLKTGEDDAYYALVNGSGWDCGEPFEEEVNAAEKYSQQDAEPDLTVPEGWKPAPLCPACDGPCEVGATCASCGRVNDQAEQADDETHTCAECGAEQQIEPCANCGASEICRTCNRLYHEGGDGFDGECPSCADASNEKEERADSLVERIANAITDDTSGGSGDGARIVAQYEDADPKTREAIDNIFTSLCGWRLETLIAGKELTDGE